MNRRFVWLPTLLAVFAFTIVALDSDDAEASWAEIWVRGHGSFITGPDSLRYFESNDAGAGYGAGVGVELLQIDLFMDLNFHPNGSMFNVLGLGVDFDLVPGERIYFAPAANVGYFFGPHENEDSPSEGGFLARGGAQFEVNIFPTGYIGLEALGGGMFSVSEDTDYETGWVFTSALYFAFRFGI